MPFAMPESFKNSNTVLGSIAKLFVVILIKTCMIHGVRPSLDGPFLNTQDFVPLMVSMAFSYQDIYSR